MNEEKPFEVGETVLWKKFNIPVKIQKLGGAEPYVYCTGARDGIKERYFLPINTLERIKA